MRIEPGEHARDRLVHQLLVIDRLDVIGFYRAENIGKGANLFKWDGSARVAERVRRNAQTDHNAGNSADTDKSETTSPASHATPNFDICRFKH